MRGIQRALVPIGLVVAVVAGVCLRGAWAQDAAPARRNVPARIATADVLGIVERMILSDRYRPAQTAFTDEQNAKLKPLADALIAMENQGNKMAPNAPELEGLRRTYEQKRDEFGQARTEAMAKIDAFNTDQVREAYRLTLAALGEMATKQGYTHVVASRSGPSFIRSDNVPGALQEILARPMAVSDPADDLTDQLIKQFKLEDVKLDEGPTHPAAPVAPAPAPSPSPTPTPAPKPAPAPATPTPPAPPAAPK